MLKIPEVLNENFYTYLLNRVDNVVSDLLPTAKALEQITFFSYDTFPCSETVEKLETGKELYIAGLVTALNGEKWKRIAETLTAEYKPLENYNRKTEIFDTVDHGKTEKTVTPTGGTTTTTTPTGTTRTVSQLDVATYDGETKRENVSTVSTTPENVSTVSTVSTMDGTNTVESTEHFTETVERFGKTLTAEEISAHVESVSGNIGVTTSQQMAESEILLRLKYNFANMVISDIAYYVGGAEIC